MRETIGHEVLAGVIGGASVLGGAFTSPFLAPAVDLVSAAVTAGLVAHAVHSSALPAGGPSPRAVRAAARHAARKRGASLAAHALDAACRAQVRDVRALRSLSMLVGRAFDAHARGIALGLVGAFCPPVRHASRVMDLTTVARAARGNADLVRDLRATACAGGAADAVAPREAPPLRDDEAPSPRDDEAPPASGRFPIADDRGARVAA